MWGLATQPCRTKAAEEIHTGENKQAARVSLMVTLKERPYITGLGMTCSELRQHAHDRFEMLKLSVPMLHKKLEVGVIWVNSQTFKGCWIGHSSGVELVSLNSSYSSSVELR